MQIEEWTLDRIHPYHQNAKQHHVDWISKSIDEFNIDQPIVVDGEGVIIKGHGRLKAAKDLGLKTFPVVVRTDLTPEQVRLCRIADNRSAEGGWDTDLLVTDLHDLNLDGFDFSLEDLGISQDWFEELEIEDVSLDEVLSGERKERHDPDELDDVPEIDEDAEPITQPGDLWMLGNHRLLCGDATKPEDVARLMQSDKAELLFEDPPYGMGKEKDGVENDNLYREKLDAFLMSAWRAVLPSLSDVASVYIWGNAEDLWRLWYCGSLKESTRLTFRNEIVWDKGNGQGQMSKEFRMYATATERALFFMLGEQGFNTNADNYWTGWDSIVIYLEQERQKAGFSIKDTKRIAGHSEKSGCHWFDKSQWMMPTKEVYTLWQQAAKGDAFKREYDAFKREYDDLKREYDDLKREWYETRAYFDNTHENMTDVWQYQRVQGEERHGHATPKPVALCERAIKSSSKPGNIVFDGFGGSGTTLIACEQTGRKARLIEISPHYCDVIVKRWETLTGNTAHREERS